MSLAEDPFHAIPSWCPLQEGPVLVQLKHAPERPRWTRDDAEAAAAVAFLFSK